jgi:hypothetical protein
MPHGEVIRPLRDALEACDAGLRDREVRVREEERIPAHPQVDGARDPRDSAAPVGLDGDTDRPAARKGLHEVERTVASELEAVGVVGRVAIGQGECARGRDSENVRREDATLLVERCGRGSERTPLVDIVEPHDSPVRAPVR